MKKFHWKDYFSFSKKERKAAVAIVLIVGAVTFAAIVLQAKDDDKYITTKFDKELDDSVAMLEQKKNVAPDSAKTFLKNEINENDLFTFDPNTLNEAGWKRLGLNDRGIHTIINYRNKGGRFYKPEDIQKIYGLDKTIAAQLIPYVDIAVNHNAHENNSDQQKDNAAPNHYQKQYKAIDINTATEEEWKSLPGIGDVLSKRIVKFRTSKGSFQSVDDVAKTYGLKDSVFRSIKPYLKLSPAEE